MKISVESWHYKLVTAKVFGGKLFHESEVSHSLCKYFWQVIAAFLGVCLFTVTSATPLGFLVYSITGFVAWMVTGVYVPDDTLVIGIIVLVTINVGCLFALACKIFEYIVRYRHSDGLFSSYVKAKADKICPIIEFTK